MHTQAPRLAFDSDFMRNHGSNQSFSEKQSCKKTDYSHTSKSLRQWQGEGFQVPQGEGQKLQIVRSRFVKVFSMKMSLHHGELSERPFGGEEGNEDPDGMAFR